MIDIPETIRYIQATHSGIGVTADGRAADEDNPGWQRRGLGVCCAKGARESLDCNRTGGSCDAGR